MWEAEFQDDFDKKETEILIERQQPYISNNISKKQKKQQLDIRDKVHQILNLQAFTSQNLEKWFQLLRYKLNWRRRTKHKNVKALEMII